MEEMKERWRAVVGYEGIYEVSDFGNVKRVKAGPSTFIGKVLVSVPDTRGYMCVCLYNDGKRHTALVHHLVTKSFLGDRPLGREVNHINGDKKNNRLENLEYVTSSENQRHAYRIGLKSNKGEKHPGSKLTEDDVYEILHLLETGVAQAEIARCFDVTRTTIWRIAHGKNWTHLKEGGDGDE